MLKKSCCELAYDARRLWQCMLTHTTWLISNMDPIKYIFKNPSLTYKITRWQILLSEYEIQHVTQKAIKGSVLAYHLAHQPVEDYQPLKFDFPDENIMAMNYENIINNDEGTGPGESFTLNYALTTLTILLSMKHEL